MSKLTREDIERQDFVDNQIYDLINSLIHSENRIEWNIEMIGNIREIVRREVVENRNIMSEMEFYPFVHE